MTSRRSSEAFWWSLFSAGGVLSALFLPVLVVISGVLLPAFWLERHDAAYRQVRAMVAWWPVSGLLFVVIAFSFFHAAHRIRHVVMDMGWRHATAPLSAGCYGGALLGSAVAGWLLLRLHGAV